MLKSIPRFFHIRTKAEAAAEAPSGLANIARLHSAEEELRNTASELFTANGRIRDMRLELQQANARADQQKARADGLVDQLAYNKKDRDRLAEVTQQTLSTAERLKKDLAESLEANRKLQVSLDVSRDRRVALVTQLASLREASNCAMKWLFENSSAPSEAFDVACALADELNT